jgi:hypothetical protein
MVFAFGRLGGRLPHVRKSPFVLNAAREIVREKLDANEPTGETLRYKFLRYLPARAFAPAALGAAGALRISLGFGWI